MGIILYPFWSKAEKRLRALWRILLHLFIWLASAIALTFPLNLLRESSNDNLLLAIITTVSLLAVLGAMLFSLWFNARFIDRRISIRDFGLRNSSNWLMDLTFGLLLGFGLMLGIFLVELAFGMLTIQSTFVVANPEKSFWLEMIVAIISFIAVGIYEELLSRGYQMKNMAEGLKFLSPRNAVILAWILSSVVFGLLHLANPNASLISTANIMLGGLFLGLPILLTGKISISIGLHIAWNFAQGNIFGFPVSGNASSVSFIGIEQQGQDLWTGGAFGPEAGLIGIIAILLGMGAILLWISWREKKIGIYSDYAAYTPKS